MTKFCFNFFLCVAFATGLCSTVLADEQISYLAKMEDSKWTLTTKDTFLCELTHEIPGFGSAVFSKEPARPIKLKLNSKIRYKAGTEVSFRSVSASWKAKKLEANIATIVITESEKFEIGDPYARQALVELGNGSFPSFFFFDQDHKDTPVAVALSTVRFNKAVDSFYDCVNQLYKDNFEDLNIAYIHFDFDEEFPLLAEEMTVFKDMLAYAKADKSVSRFVVTGHADERGKECYNDTLSERRALYVFDLLAGDIGDSKIDYQFAGESLPIDKAKNEKAWAKNRRVKVEMFRKR
ncbi:MAG: OmpA family protein [Gammaproteobacteria bacterium]|nr:OmpA family protein [Gammaproteobacteria bacterium]